MWSTIAKYLVKAALWAAQHPDEVRALVDQLHPPQAEPKV